MGKIAKAACIVCLAFLSACEEPANTSDADSPTDRATDGAASAVHENGGESGATGMTEDMDGSEGSQLNEASGERAKSPAVPVSTVVDGLNDLTFRLLAALPAGDGGNLFLSPYSVSQAIAPLALGARGETAAQILAFLGATETGEDDAGDFGSSYHASNRELAERVMAIPQGDPTTFRIANRIWHEKTLPWEASFRDAVKRSYGSGAQPADFRADADGERKQINAWIADQTEQKIPNLLPEGSLTSTTRLVLANAIYFLGEWKDAFDPKATKPLPFHSSPDDSVETPFLVRTGTYKVADVDDTWILELPYEGEKFSMIVLLPGERDGLPALEQELSLATFESWTSNLLTRKVDVFLPKFEMRTKVSLEKPLAAMGLTLPFDPSGADFSGISTAERLCVDRVFHEAYVQVDEKGTEAAAATAATVGLTSMPAPNPVFRADHPFVFVIRENDTGLIVFVGRVGNPAASS